MATTMEVDVDELCTKTVARRPMTTPATGFASADSSVNTLPAVLPPRSRNAELRKLKEQIKRYKKPRRKATFTTPMTTRRTFPFAVSSVKKKNSK